MDDTTPRLSAPVLAEAWALPGKPDGGAADLLDTFRQTGFQLGDDLRLVAEGMNLQLALVHDSAHARFRTERLAAMLLPWSRAFAGLSDAVLLATRGGYASCPAVVRSACEMLAASVQLPAEELTTFREWAGGAFTPDDEHHATDVGMGEFFAGSTIAADPMLDGVYRAASDLARSHLGASLLLTGPESNRTRLALTFGDRAFHFAWAQLVIGWVLSLNECALRTGTSESSPLNVTDERRAEIESWRARALLALADGARCTMTRVVTATGPRWLVSNVRRQASGAPKKFLL